MLVHNRLTLGLIFGLSLIILVFTGTGLHAQAESLIDLNTASPQELESLPGIGKISAHKIIAGRPYKSVDDLAKAGIPAKNIGALKPLVTISPAKAAPAPGGAPRKQVKAAEPAKIIDLNAASQQELETLPDIGKTSAKKIIAGRPYASVNDLAKAGLKAKTISALKPLVTVSAAPPKASAKTSPPAAPAVSTPPPSGPSTKAAPAGKLAPGQMVNLNTASQEMLETLPEIGPVKAQAIINNRPYQKIADIMKVKGIKEGTFNKIKDRITVH